MKTKVIIKDNGYKKLMKNLQGPSAATTTVGIHRKDASKDSDGEQIIDIAAAHEFGLGVPRRSWLRDVFDSEKRRLEKRLIKIADLYIKKAQPLTPMMQRFGALFSAELQTKGISTQNGPSGKPWKPLSEETKRRKGSSGMLLDEGILRSSISHETKAKK